MELTEFQFKALDDAANEGNIVFAVAEPRPNDTLHEAVRFGQQVREIEELVKEGFVKEVSKEFAKTVEATIAAEGRSCRVFALTPMGLLLFQRRTGRKQ